MDTRDSMMDDRVLVFEGIHNFRDYGGYAARGGHLKRGVLWRSGHHAGATVDDLVRVHDLGIATVIDLRGDSERAAHPCLRHDEFDGTVLFHPGETASQRGRAVHEEATTPDAAEARAMMVRLYQSMPFRPVLVGTWRLYVQALATREGASLLHCLAGKDRTGMGVALVQHMLGVHPDDIMADYLLTNTAGNVEARIAALSRTMTNRGLDDAARRVILGVEAEYLDVGLAAIRAEHGSIDAYVRDVLGADVPAMEARLVT
jgi:protein-tyrosine phosphatase